MNAPISRPAEAKPGNDRTADSSQEFRSMACTVISTAIDEWLLKRTTDGYRRRCRRTLRIRGQNEPGADIDRQCEMVVLKKKATTQCSVVILRILFEVTLTSAVAQAVPMMKE